MQYNGGKQAVSKQISEIINKVNPINYLEPFFGIGSVAMKINAVTKVGYDLDPDIICTLNAIKNGWIPPSFVSEEEYKERKGNPIIGDPLTGFIKFGCSFGCKPCGGYARSNNRNYALNAKNSLLKKKYLLDKIDIYYGNYLDIDITNFDTIYCDPPYKNTAKVGCGIQLDYDIFYDWCRNVVKLGKNLFITEKQMPDDFVVIWEKQLNDGLGNKKLKERLWVHNTSTKLLNL